MTAPSLRPLHLRLENDLTASVFSRNNKCLAVDQFLENADCFCGGRKRRSHAWKVFSESGGQLLPSSAVRELDNESWLWNDQKEDEEEEVRAAQRRTERKLADVWRDIHGEDGWGGMLDPMDPLLRSELIRYGEMAQACYDAFDFDPFSKYCGSCKYTRRQLFESLEMTHHGYEVSRYLYATSNINLPSFFKKSRWPKVWSRHANWIGYVAVSDEETSKHLGRRDIAIAWRGTVTRLEWIADLMDFLKPISSNGIPCPDSSVKAESGFLDLFTEKDEACR